MADLISRKAALRCIEESRDTIDWGQSEDGDAFLHYTGALYRTMASAECVPTIDAIPVEWIEWRIAHAEREGFGAVVSMLRTARDWWNDQRDVWQKEQEAQDG